MTLQSQEKRKAFCQTLFQEACTEARKRLGREPKTEHIQMIDLLNAFRGLKLDTYVTQFGHINTEWNEALTIITEYTSTVSHKEPHHLPTEIGQAIGNALVTWHLFDKLPLETKESLQKTHSGFTASKKKLLPHVIHFFNELKVRISSLSPSERETIIALLSVYEPTCKASAKKGLFSEMEVPLNGFFQELNRLLQKKNPSRDLQSFITKTHHDIERFKTMFL